MDPIKVFLQIQEFQTSGVDCSEWIDQNNLRENPNFIQCLRLLLQENNNVPNSHKLLVLCFMKQYTIHFQSPEDLLIILPYLDNDELNDITAKLIISHYATYDELFDCLEAISKESANFFLQLLDHFIEKNQFDENSIENVKNTIIILNAYARDLEIDYELRLRSVKSIISISRAIKDEEIIENISKILIEIFNEYEIKIENKNFFYEILRLRSTLESIDPINFYKKVQELSKFFVQAGPPITVDDSSFLFYLSESIFHMIEFSNSNLNDYLVIDIKELVFILALFTVYNDEEIKNWSDDVEEFFSSNSNYLLPEGKKILEGENDEDIDGNENYIEDDENSIFKESFQLHQFIYSQFIRLGKFQIDENMNLLSLAIQTYTNLIGCEIQNYSTGLVNLSSILFFSKFESIIEFDAKKYILTGNDVSLIYFVYYCSKKGIVVDEISSKIESFLSNDTEMFKLLTASILINYNIKEINPDLYSICFYECLKTIENFFSERVTGLIDLLFLLADFENKPLIVSGFKSQMTEIMKFLVEKLILFQNAYQSTASMCNLIAHFIRFIDFQYDLLPFFLDFIKQLCSSSSFANLGIRLENAILNCKSARSSLEGEILKDFYSIFAGFLDYFDSDYLCENPSIIQPILLIANFFAKNSIIDGIEKKILLFLSEEKIRPLYFDKIAPLVISLIKNDKSIHRFEILQKLIKRSDLLSIDFDNPLIYPTIAVLAHLGIDNSEHFKPLMKQFQYNFIDILSAIFACFKANLSVMDDRLILVMLSIFGDCEIYIGDQGATEILSVVIQPCVLNFFNKVAECVINNQFDELKKSSFFEEDDAVFSTDLMSCSFSNLLNALIPDSSDYSIIQRKALILNFLVEKGL